MNAWIWLLIAIASEVIATSSLKATEGFTRLGPSIVVLVGYVGSFWCVSQTLDTIPLGVAYAVWSGVGIAASQAVRREARRTDPSDQAREYQDGLLLHGGAQELHQG